MIKTENTLKNKAAFFAQYWEQSVCNDIGCALRNETFEDILEYAEPELTPTAIKQLGL